MAADYSEEKKIEPASLERGRLTLEQRAHRTRGREAYCGIFTPFSPK